MGLFKKWKKISTNKEKKKTVIVDASVVADALGIDKNALGNKVVIHSGGKYDTNDLYGEKTKTEVSVDVPKTRKEEVAEFIKILDENKIEYWKHYYTLYITLTPATPENIRELVKQKYSEWLRY